MESTIYRYVDHLEAPKKWFKSNVDSIMKIYGQAHGIQKEDIFLGQSVFPFLHDRILSTPSASTVIGTLSAPDYALFVSHSHPDGQAHFNVFSSPKGGRPWGTFTTDTNLPEGSGPNYDEDVPGNPVSASKVSLVGRSRWDTVLMARLRFKPDVAEPTSL
jgi:abelson tyrosine-protein kinase 1